MLGDRLFCLLAFLCNFAHVLMPCFGPLNESMERIVLVCFLGRLGAAAGVVQSDNDRLVCVAGVLSCVGPQQTRT